MPLSFGIDVLAGRRRMVATDLHGRRGIAFLRGFNFSGHCKRDGLPCRSLAVAKALYARVAADGFNLLRVPIVWEKLTVDGDAKLATLVELVKAAGDAGLFVLIDLHQDLLGSSFRRDDDEYHGTGFPRDLLEGAFRAAYPDTPWRDGSWRARFTWQENYRKNEQLQKCFLALAKKQDDIAAFATRIGALFGPLPNVIGFEVINEPMWPLVDKPYHDYYKMVAKALEPYRAFAMPKADWLYRYVVRGNVPIFQSSAEAIEAGIDPKQLPKLEVSTPHIYAPMEMARVPLYKPPAHVVPMVVEWHRRNGDLPFIVGEFGVPANLSKAPQHLAAWVGQFEAHGVSWCLWNLNPEADADGNDHWCGERMSVAAQGTGDATTLSERYDALLRPFVTLASGDIRDVRFGGGWTFGVTIGKAPGPGLRTVIVIPPALGEYEVTRFTGASFRQDGRTVTFTTDDAGIEIELIKHRRA